MLGHVGGSDSCTWSLGSIKLNQMLRCQIQYVDMRVY